MTSRTLENMIFWLKPDGRDCCDGKLQEKEHYICMKASLMMYSKFPIDCKYLKPNYDYPDLTQCVYDIKK